MQQVAQVAREQLGLLARLDLRVRQVAQVAQAVLEPLALLARLDLLARQAAQVARGQLGLRARQVAMEALAQLGLQTRLVLLDPQVQEEAREVQGPLAHLAQLDPLVPQELQAQAEGRQEPLGLLAPLVLLLRLEQTVKCNTTMAALQWVELQSFTTTTLQIE